MPEATAHPTASLARRPLFGHHLLMPKRKAKDAQRVSFVAVPGSSELYAEAAELEGIRVDAWIRAILHDAATRVLEAHGRDTTHLPAIHIQRPPRLQPRAGEPDGGGGGTS